MKKSVLYTYLGTNGSLTTPIHLEDIYYVRKIKLMAEGSKMYLTKDNQKFYKTVTVAEEEVGEWKEVIWTGQE